MTQNCRGVRKPLQPERRKDKHPRPCISDPWGRHTHTDTSGLCILGVGSVTHGPGTHTSVSVGAASGVRGKRVRYAQALES